MPDITLHPRSPPAWGRLRRFQQVSIGVFKSEARNLLIIIHPTTILFAYYKIDLLIHLTYLAKKVLDIEWLSETGPPLNYGHNEIARLVLCRYPFYPIC